MAHLQCALATGLSVLRAPHVPRTLPCATPSIHPLATPRHQASRRHLRAPLAAASESDAKPSSSKNTLKGEAEDSAREVSDKLIAVFRAKDRGEWRKLIAHSKKWSTLSKGVLARVHERMEAMEDPEEKLEWRKFWRGLKTVNEEILKYGDVIAKCRDTEVGEWDSIAARHRADLGDNFFDYVRDRISASVNDDKEREFLIDVGTRLGALLDAFDAAAADEAAMDDAANTLDQLLQTESLEQADMMIDNLAESGRLDPALLLTMAKAWSGVKESPYTQEEVKDVMYHLYMRAREAAAQQQPPEVRILKHLLSLDDPGERSHALNEAFTPGADFETATEDYLCTTPPALLATVDAVLGAHKAAAKGSMLGDAAGMMNPEVITKLSEIRAEIDKRHM